MSAEQSLKPPRPQVLGLPPARGGESIEQRVLPQSFDVRLPSVITREPAASPVPRDEIDVKIDALVALCRSEREGDRARAKKVIAELTLDEAVRFAERLRTTKDSELREFAAGPLRENLRTPRAEVGELILRQLRPDDTGRVRRDLTARDRATLGTLAEAYGVPVPAQKGDPSIDPKVVYAEEAAAFSEFLSKSVEKVSTVQLGEHDKWSHELWFRDGGGVSVWNHCNEAGSLSLRVVVWSRDFKTEVRFDALRWREKKGE